MDADKRRFLDYLRSSALICGSFLRLSLFRCVFRVCVVYSCCLLCFAVAMVPGKASSATYFSTDFGAMPLHSALEDVNSAFTITVGSSLPGNVIRRGTSAGPLDRRYVRTRASDYNTVDFVYEITLSNSGDGISFIGLGEGVGSGASQEPTNAVFWRVLADTIEFVYQQGGDDPVPETVSMVAAETDYRARITKQGDQLLFALDEDNDGSFEFTPSTTVDLSSPTFDFLNDPNHGRLFFGTAFTQREFDDMRLLDGLAGDMNDDGVVDSADVAPFTQALVSRSQYETQFPSVLADLRGDIDSSGVFDLGDLGPFTQMLSASSQASVVPEPGGLLLALCALGILLVPRLL